MATLAGLAREIQLEAKPTGFWPCHGLLPEFRHARTMLGPGFPNNARAYGPGLGTPLGVTANSQEQSRLSAILNCFRYYLGADRPR